VQEHLSLRFSAERGVPSWFGAPAYTSPVDAPWDGLFTRFYIKGLFPPHRISDFMKTPFLNNIPIQQTLQ